MTRRSQTRIRWAPALVPAALMLLAIAAPSAGLLWFMARAMEYERLLVRQIVAELAEQEAARHATAAADRFGEHVAALEHVADSPYYVAGPAGFKSLALVAPRGGIVLLDESDQIKYPADPAVEIGPLPGGARWQEAQRLEFVEKDYTKAIEQYQDYGFSAEPEERLQDVAFIAMGRCAAKKGDMPLAVTWLTGIRPLDPLATGLGLWDNRGNLREPDRVEARLANPYPDLARYYDAQGNLLRASALDRGLEIAATMDPTRFGSDPYVCERLEQTLRGWLVDYEGTPMRPAQRQLLMESSLRRAARPDNSPLPRLLAAERAARRLLDEAAERPELPVPGRLVRVEESGPVPINTTNRVPTGPGQLASMMEGELWLYRAGERGEIAWVLPRSDLDALLGDARGEGEEGAAPDEDAFGGRLQFPLVYYPPSHTPTAHEVHAPLGDRFPGWHVIASGDMSGLSEESYDVRTATYVWTGALLLAVVLCSGALLLTFHLRQLRIARLKNDLIATVSHELRTPLASMRVLVDTLIAGRIPEEAQQQEYLALIGKENHRLSRMVDNFLTFSRMERNKTQFDFANARVAEIVEEAAASVKERFEAAGRPLAIEVPDGLPPIPCDADALVTALINLLDNAHKFTPDAAAPIEVRAGIENGAVSLAVRDSGIGLSRRARRKVFQRYYQVDQRLARSAGGCGLGLSIVRFIVEAHGGEVRVESTPGGGSTFTLVLPVADVESEGM